MDAAWNANLLILKPPRSIVNRIHRLAPVFLQTVARVGKALAKASQISPHSPKDTSRSNSPNSVVSWWIPGSWLFEVASRLEKDMLTDFGRVVLGELRFQQERGDGDHPWLNRHLLPLSADVR